MKKGLIFICALLIAFVAYAIPAKQMPNQVKESDEIKRDYSTPAPKALICPGVVISTTGYADAWRGTASMAGKSIVVDPTGTKIGVVFGKANESLCDLLLGYSLNGGATWDTKIIASNMNARIYNGLALDNSNTPYIVWQDRDTNSIQWMKDEGGIGAGTWTSPDTLARDSMAWYLPSMSIRGEKIAISAYAYGKAAGDYGVGDYSIHMVLSNDLGATWVTPWDRLPLPYGWNRWTYNIYPDWGQYEADWIFSPSGDTVLGFFELVLDTIGYNISGGYDGFWPAYKISYDGGVTYSEIQYFTPPEQYNYGGWWYRYDGTWAAGKPHFLLVHSDKNWNWLALFDYTPTVAGDYSNWTLTLVSDISGNQATNFNGGMCDFPSISYDEYGNIFAVYHDMSKTSDHLELFGAASTDGGATWLTPVQMTDANGDLDGDIFCEQSENAANGLVHVIYHDSVYQKIYYYSYPTAALLAAPTRPDPMTLPCELVSITDLPGAAGGPAGDGTIDVINDDTLYFIWSPKVPIEGTYELLVSTISDFSAYVYQFKDGRTVRNYAWDGTDYPDDIGVPGMPSTGVWYWKVRSHRDAEVSPWSEVFDFDYQGTVLLPDPYKTIWTCYAEGVEGNLISIPIYKFSLNQCLPNPVNGNAAISFSLPKAGNYSLKIYNVAGQLIRTLDGRGTAGKNTVTWNCLDNNARKAANGVYLYNLNAFGNSATKKLVVLR